VAVKAAAVWRISRRVGIGFSLEYFDWVMG
jgi:hypothetical protein